MSELTPAQRRALYELHKRQVRKDVVHWAKTGIKHFQPPNANFAPSQCHNLLLTKLDQVAKGLTKNLMVFMPSGFGKSTYLSMVWPPHLLATNPKINVIAASNTQDFAEKISTNVQSVMQQYADVLGAAPATFNKKDWVCTNGSTYRATGVGGSVLGERADVGIIDDPFGGFSDASSPTIRDNVYNWYRNDFVTRLKPGAKTILMHQRVHLDDLAGRLLLEEPDEWEVLFLPAIWEGTGWDGKPQEHDELGRSTGDLLWPDYYSADVLAEKRRRVGEQSWASMYQQRPIPAGGALFHAKKLQANRIPFDELPKAKKWVRAWDQAASKKGDWTAGVLMMRGVDDRYYVVDVTLLRGGPEEVRALILKTAAEDVATHGRVKVCLGQDPGAAGKWVIADLTKALAGHDVEASPETGAKEDRARPYAAQLNAGNVFMVEGAWNQKYVDELSVFPGGTYDDQVDASSRAFANLIDMGIHYAPRRYQTGSSRIYR